MRRRPSFPYWERGLKLIGIVMVIVKIASFPYWERGLKSDKPIDSACQLVSFPYWERGLKFSHEGIDKKL